MNKTRTLLISGLATVMVMIALVQTKAIQLRNPILNAQLHGEPLTLKKGDRKVVIQPGDKIVVNRMINNPLRNSLFLKSVPMQNGYNYKSVNIELSEILTNKGTIPFTELKSIGVKTGTQAGKGFALGALGGGVLGAGMGFMLSGNTGPDSDVIVSCAGIFAAVGGVVGLIQGEFTPIASEMMVIGNGEWEIVNSGFITSPKELPAGLTLENSDVSADSKDELREKSVKNKEWEKVTEKANKKQKEKDALRGLAWLFWLIF